MTKCIKKTTLILALFAVEQDAYAYESAMTLCWLAVMVGTIATPAGYTRGQLCDLRT